MIQIQTESYALSYFALRPISMQKALKVRRRSNGLNVMDLRPICAMVLICYTHLAPMRWWMTCATTSAVGRKVQEGLLDCGIAGLKDLGGYGEDV